VEPRDTAVRRGEDAILHCSVFNLQGRPQWVKNDFALGLGPLFDGYPRYRILQQLPSSNGTGYILSELHVTTSGARGDTICLRPLQVDNIFVFIRQVAPVPACWLFKTSAAS